MLLYMKGNLFLNLQTQLVWFCCCWPKQPFLGLHCYLICQWKYYIDKFAKQMDSFFYLFLPKNSHVGFTQLHFRLNQIQPNPTKPFQSQPNPAKYNQTQPNQSKRQCEENQVSLKSMHIRPISPQNRQYAESKNNGENNKYGICPHFQRNKNLIWRQISSCCMAFL